MTEFIARLVIIGCLFPITIGAMKIATAMTAEPDVHQFLNLDAAPLWSNSPVRIDIAAQTYERVPGTEIAATPARAPAEVEMTLSAAPAVLASDEYGRESASAVAWCRARYRSYNQTDNSYQPYGGGPRRDCVPPASLDNGDQIAQVAQPMPTNEHAQWCMNRYSSYRAEDDTYQPFSGARKRCMSPIATTTQPISNMQASM